MLAASLLAIAGKQKSAGLRAGCSFVNCGLEARLYDVLRPPAKGSYRCWVPGQGGRGGSLSWEGGVGVLVGEHLVERYKKQGVY